jgi:DNA-binding transcriptional ArsR family regulator
MYRYFCVTTLIWSYLSARRENSYKKALTGDYRFHIIGNMETKQIINALGALAQESRLAIFRLLVEAGPPGLAVGAIAESLGLANATLSFHLKELTQAGLTVATPNGRSIIYSANFATMNGLVDYLTENCCAGAGCATATSACAPVSARQKSPSTLKRRPS